MEMRQFYPGPHQGAKWGPQDMIIAPPTAGNYKFVDGNKSTGGSGTTWSDAYATIEAATDAASRGDIVLVAPMATNSYYAENVRIPKGDDNTSDEYGLCGLHVMGVTNGLKNVRIRAAQATNKHAYSSLSAVSMLGAAIFVSCAGIEISHMCLDGEGDYYAGIYWGDGYRPFAYSGQTDAMNGYVHDCTFMFGTNGIDYDGCSNDQLVENCLFYKQTDVGIYLGPGGLQQTSRVRVKGCEFNGPEDYGVYGYSHAQLKNNVIGPNNVFTDQASATEMTNPVYFANATPTNNVLGNWMCNDTDNAAGTHDNSCGNYEGVTGATVLAVTED